MPDFKTPAVNLDDTIVYEDEWLLGINKTAGLRVHNRGKFVNANLIYHQKVAGPTSCAFTWQPEDIPSSVMASTP